ncbi:MAG TPA: hypothetical protein PKY87_07825 [Terricaulis sp.]|nr:hypothetical protein [Terricaulis sp.]
MRKLLALAAATAALGLAAPASAETINLSGSVSQVCALTPGTTNVNFGNLGAQGVENPISINYNLYCNVNFDSTFSSANGRLLNTNAPIALVGPETGAGAHAYDGSTTFFAALDYVITPSIGGPVSSASFGAGATTNLGSNPPTTLSVSLEFDTVELTGGQQLTAGSYSDTITIGITPTGL